jgi:hypothetical protein
MASLFDKIMQSVKTAPSRQSYGTTAAPQAMPQNAMSIFDMIRAPQQAQFNVQAAQGAKAKNYQPTTISMTGMPVASVFGLPGASAMPQDVFSVTPATGAKAKNYKPAQIAMNAPSLAGPSAMQQMLAMMGNNRSASPFAPFGQG